MMMKNNGHCLISFLGWHAVFATYRKLAELQQWSKYTEDVEEFIAPYHDDPKGDVTFRQLMLECGFKTADVVEVDVDYKPTGRLFNYENHKCKYII